MSLVPSKEAPMPDASIERYQPPQPAGLAPITEPEWKLLERKAAVVAHVTKRDRDEVLAVGLALYPLGVDLNQFTFQQTWVADGKVNLMAQLTLGIAQAHGVDAWFPRHDEPDAPNERRAILFVTRKPGRVESYEYTIDMARRYGLLDEWVEKWETSSSGKKYATRFTVAVDGVPVDKPIPDWARKELEAGRVKRKEPWFRSRVDMLMCRAATFGLKRAAPGVLLGIANLDWTGIPDDEPAPPPRPRPAQLEDGDGDGDIADAEVVDDDDPADDWDRQSLLARRDRLDPDGVACVRDMLAEFDPPLPGPGSPSLTKGHVARYETVLQLAEEEMAERHRAANQPAAEPPETSEPAQEGFGFSQEPFG